MTHFSTSWTHIRRSPYQTLLGISITSLTFFVVGLVIYTAVISSSLLSYFEQKPQITAFFKDNKDETAIGTLKEKLSTTGKVAKTRFISKEEALKIYQEQNKSDPLLLEMVTAEILPSSLEVSATDPRYLPDLARILKDEPGVDEIIYQKDIIDTLLTWTATIRLVGIALIVFFSLLSILVTLTITGMKIVLRKEEIEILKLVGATRSYISSPFITEGLVYGVTGALVGWIFDYAILLYATPFISSLLSGIPSLSLTLAFSSIALTVWPVTWQFMLVLLAILSTVGAVLGALGSHLALWRYMRS